MTDHQGLQAQSPPAAIDGASPRVSVIIPAYQAAATLDDCLDALVDQTLPSSDYEVIVVDDGSTDDTLRRAQARARDGVRWLAQDHAGPAAARNLGVEQARGEIVLFTDADCAPAPDWIERLVAPFATPEGRPLHAESDGSAAAPLAGVKGTYLTRQPELMARFVQFEYEDKYDRMARHPTIDFIDTYSAGYRRDLFLANGGFEMGFPLASVEDQEFSFRLARQGYRLLFVPDARVYHLGHARTLWEYGRKKFKIGFWKVLVHKRHPDKLWRDSHTPQILKVQILLVGVAILCGIAALLVPFFFWGLGIAGLAFLLTTVPFVRKVWHKAPAVALVAPALLFARALALGSGFVLGLIVHPLSGTAGRAERGTRTLDRESAGTRGKAV